MWQYLAKTPCSNYHSRRFQNTSSADDHHEQAVQISKCKKKISERGSEIYPAVLATAQKPPYRPSSPSLRMMAFMVCFIARPCSCILTDFDLLWLYLFSLQLRSNSSVLQIQASMVPLPRNLHKQALCSSEGSSTQDCESETIKECYQKCCSPSDLDVLELACGF